ncbi:hypothetical protein BDR06DRAFT_1012725 [Suillus hirtellus]|nr:hypothetical protein BDR06DRAFT_1012725 [Suillus hirtellus]
MSEASRLYRGSSSLLDSHILLDGLSANLLADKDLLHNPLAPALESMRGPPSLRPKGTENVLCLLHRSPDWRTETGVFIHRWLSSLATPSITIHVARIIPATRAPRTDDPTPRKLPQHLLTRTQSIGELAVDMRIKVKGDDSEVVRRTREVMLHLPNVRP